MAQWRIKEVSDLTHISVRMLRHYDKIGLLKPSVRSANNYRWYGEQDLLRLQQIIALKFFGFELKQIKAIMQHNLGMYDHLRAQQAMIKEQVEQLNQVQEALEITLQRLEPSYLPNWNQITSLIERYRMADQIKKSWAGKVFNQKQLKTFVDVAQQLTHEQLLDYQKRWRLLIKEVEANLEKDPKTATGKRLAKAWLALIDELWAAHPEIKEAVDEAYKEGNIENPPCSKEVAEWVEAACKAHNLLKR